jgi:hypothetical protein
MLFFTHFIMLVAMPQTPDIDILRAYLRDRDVACPVCRYSLSSCQSNVCPECGTPIRLVLQEAPRRGFRAHPHWLFSVAVFSWVAFTGTLSGLSLLFALGSAGLPREYQAHAAVNLVLAVASVAGLVLVARNWRFCLPQAASAVFRLARLVAVIHVLQYVGWIVVRIFV